MRVKYNAHQNDIVLECFNHFLVNHFFVPLFLNILLAFILFFLSFNWMFRSLYDGILSIRLYEVLLIPLMVIPVINVFQTMLFIYIGINKILNGEYVVDRYKIYDEGYFDVTMGDKVKYPKSIFSKKFKTNDSFADVISILNNYGTIIWTLVIPPLELPPKETTANYIIQKPNKYKIVSLTEGV